MDSASMLIKINALAVWFVGNHRGPGNTRMGLCPIVHWLILFQNPDGIALTAERATVAWDLFDGEILRQWYSPAVSCQRKLCKSFMTSNTVWLAFQL
jgi:hypothetical protein